MNSFHCTINTVLICVLDLRECKGLDCNMFACRICNPLDTASFDYRNGCVNSLEACALLIRTGMLDKIMVCSLKVAAAEVRPLSATHTHIHRGVSAWYVVHNRQYRDRHLALILASSLFAFKPDYTYIYIYTSIVTFCCSIIFHCLRYTVL